MFLIEFNKFDESTLTVTNDVLNSPFNINKNKYGQFKIIIRSSDLLSRKWG